MSCPRPTTRILAALLLSIALAATGGAAEIDWDRVKRDWADFSASEQAAYSALMERERLRRAPASSDSSRTPADACGDATHEEVSLPFSEAGDTASYADLLNLAAAGGCAGGGSQFGLTGLGPEIAYRIRVDVACTLQVKLTPTATSFSDLALYVVTDCANLATSCVGVEDSGLGGVPEVVVFNADPSFDYFVIVDGYNGSAGTFDLEIIESGSASCTLVPVRVQSFSVE